jgi:hypothetical protein
MRSSVFIAALAASFVGAEPEARAEPEALPLPAPQRQIGAILGILGMVNSMQSKGKGKGKANGPKNQQCSCPAPRATTGYCANNNEAWLSSCVEPDLTINSASA